MTAAERATVLVVTRGGAALEACLDSVRASRPSGKGLGIVVVDNGSDGEAVARACARAGARRLRNERNEGFARGVNVAAAAAEAEVCVLLNDDAAAEPEAIEALVDALFSSPADVVAAAAVLTDPTGELVDFVDGLLTFDGHAFQRARGHRLSALPLDAAGEARLFPCGGFCAVRRSDFLRLGGFDEGYFAYLEDVDFGWRATLAGHRTVFVPAARARHQGGLTGRALGTARRGILFESNAFVTSYKNLGDETLRLLLPAILVTLQSRALGGLLAHEPGAAAALADPFGGPPPEPPRAAWAGPLSRRRPAVDAIRALAGFAPPEVRGARPGEALLLESEISRMWLISANRLAAAWPGLIERRRRVQALRRVEDAQLFERFPLHLVPTYPGDEALFASETFQSLLPPWPPLVRLSLADVEGRPP